MNKYGALIRHDLRQAARDPLILFILLGPLILMAGVRAAVHPLSNWLAFTFSFDPLAYADLAAVFLMLLVPQLIGTMTGFILLEERDEQLIGLYAVTPLRKQGYAMYRIALPMGLGFVMAIVFLLTSGIAPMQGENVAAAVLLALEAPLYALFLAAFAANKVEGLALSKIVVLTLTGAIAPYFVPEPWQFIAAFLPTYWPSKLLLEGSAIGDDPLRAMAAFLIGLLTHLAILYSLRRRLLSRIE